MLSSQAGGAERRDRHKPASSTEVRCYGHAPVRPGEHNISTPLEPIRAVRRGSLASPARAPPPGGEPRDQARTDSRAGKPGVVVGEA